MVKEDEILGLVTRYLNERRFDCIEALYMWSQGVPASDIANALRVRYGSGGAYSTVINDLSGLRVDSYIRETEDTHVSLDQLIRDIFRDRCVPIFLERLKESLKNLSIRARRILFILLRGGLLKYGSETPIDQLWLTYKVIFNEELSDFEKENVIRELLKCGLIEYVKSYDYKMVFPSYIDVISPEIGKIIRLPRIEVIELKEGNE